ncbi:unnamed protein product [Rhizoctonia solani]|uniref:Uncharacterized protein n=1 Tax=Rhizoctonia solani TaxID=456999 RepID=A0A8H2WY87_9AGAM|nr:unnamed protein product [Rhizoctonia solani]
MPDNNMAGIALTDMPQFLSLMAPLQDSLPDRTVNIEVYITALLTRLYSALWNAGVDATADEFRATTGYKPSVSMLIADINRNRVYAWFGLQLLFTLSGIGFIMLQSRSRYPLVEDTDMVAFDPSPVRRINARYKSYSKLSPKRMAGNLWSSNSRRQVEWFSWDEQLSTVTYYSPNPYITSCIP